MRWVSEKEGVKQLARDVITGGIQDLLFGDAIQQINAMEFLASDLYLFWTQLAEMDVDADELRQNLTILLEKKPKVDKALAKPQSRKRTSK